MNEQILRHLNILDLEPGATLDDVKIAYRELVLIWHPDKVPDRVKSRAADKFNQLTESYDWLTKNASLLEKDWSGWDRTQRQKKHYTHTSQSHKPGVMDVLRHFMTDEEIGVYVYPNMDTEKIINFVSQITPYTDYASKAARPEDILVFYDIDGSGGEGMAITRNNYLINNNIMTQFSIDDLDDVKLGEALFFWCQISVLKKGDKMFELAGYASKDAGQMFTAILERILIGQG